LKQALLATKREKRNGMHMQACQSIPFSKKKRVETNPKEVERPVEWIELKSSLSVVLLIIDNKNVGSLSGL
jgi:hypothetical protein